MNPSSSIRLQLKCI